MKRSALLAVILFSLLCMACNEDTDPAVRMTIASERGRSHDFGEDQPFPYYFVKIDDATKWEAISENIRGFIYEPGYEYVIKAAKLKVQDPPEDFNGAYVLKKIISKKKIDSQGLPSVPKW